MNGYSSEMEPQSASDCCLSGCEVEIQTFMDEGEALAMNDGLQPEVEG